MEKKYKLTEESISFNGKTLHRIEALKDFADVKKGDKIEIDIETIKKIDTKAICESDKDYLNDKEEDTTNKNKNALLSLEDLENYIPDDLVDESTNQKLEKTNKLY